MQNVIVRPHRRKAVQHETRRRIGFGYSELLIVLAILAILAAVAVPESSAALARHRLNAAARAIGLAIDETVEQSLADGKSREVVFVLGGNSVFLPAQKDLKDRAAPRVIYLTQYAPQLTITNAQFGNDDLPYFTVTRSGRQADSGEFQLSLGRWSINARVTGGIVDLGPVQ